jgi:hypothetical protein
VDGCEQFSYDTCNIESADCQREIYGLMACLRGERVEAGPPPVALMSEAAAEQMLASATPSMDPGNPDDFPAAVRGLELLGLVDPGLVGSESDVLDITIQSVAAFYRPETREVVVIDRGERANDLDANATLAHEFVHALQDRRHDLNAFGNDLELDSDRSLALLAVVEGEAMLYQLLMMLAYDGVSLDRANYDGMFEYLVQQATELTLSRGSPMVSASGIFPYTYGARYMGERWLQGKAAALDGIYEQPPDSSLEVMWTGPESDLPAIESFSDLPAALDGYRFVVDDVAGAWVLFSRLLELPGSNATDLSRLVAAWKGDRFWVYQSEDEQGAGAVLWWVDWRDSSAASRFAALWREVGSSAALSVEAVGTRTRVVIAERSADLAAWGERAGEALPP